MNNKTNIEGDIGRVESLVEYGLSHSLTAQDIQAIANILVDRERYKRLAEANIKDSEEFKNNMCEHRCEKNLVITELQAKANKYDALVEKIKNKTTELNEIANKKDLIPETVKEEKINGDIVYSKRFNAEGYIAEIILNILQELIPKEE